MLRHLHGEERTAYGLARFGDAGAVESRVKADRGATPRVTRDLRARPTIMRTASEFPHELVEDLLAASGCRVEGTAWAALEVRYGSDAKAEQLGMHSMEHLSPACRRAARVLLLASVVPGDRPPRPAGTDLLLLPLSATFFSCLAEPGPAPILPVRPDGRRIVEPRKVLNMNPAYPQTAKEQRRQGVVILEALISPAGCITSVEVLRGVAPTWTPRPCEPSRSGDTRRRCSRACRSRSA